MLNTSSVRVAVYAIAKNEAANVQNWARSCADADVRIIVDTGSSDDTVERARQEGVTVEMTIFDPWRFDVAREHSLSLIPDDIDLCISLDLDEVLVPGWREALERAFTAEATRYRYMYTWSWKDDGTAGLQYAGDKIHTRHGYRWLHPVHEVLMPLGEEVQMWTELEIHHHRDQEKSRDQYLTLLELAVAENPSDDRNAHYLGREYMYHERFAEGAQELKRHLALPTARWDAERAQSMRYLAKCEPENAEHWLKRATEETPDRRELWLDLAILYRNEGQWAQCLMACEVGLTLDRKPLHYLTEGHAWGFWLYDLAATACYELRQWERAVEYAQEAVIHEPTDLRLMSNLSQLRSAEQEWSDARVESGDEFTWRTLSAVTITEITPPKDLPDGWAAMNPSIASDGEHMLMTVRTVNYRIVSDAYVMADRDDVVRTRTGLVDIDADGHASSWRWIDDSAALAPMPNFPVRGVEDVRLFVHQGRWRVIGAIRDYAESGAIRQVIAELHDGHAPQLEQPWRLPSPLTKDDAAPVYEKNWVVDPSSEVGLDVIWSTEPYLRLRLDHLTRQVVPTFGRPSQLATHEWRGSTPIFATPNGAAYLVHRVGPAIDDPARPSRTYLHAFASPCDGHVHVGPWWSIEELALEYVAGACLLRDDFYISYGRDDRYARIARCTWDSVKALVPATCIKDE